MYQLLKLHMKLASSTSNLIWTFTVWKITNNPQKLLAKRYLKSDAILSVLFFSYKKLLKANEITRYVAANSHSATTLIFFTYYTTYMLPLLIYFLKSSQENFQEMKCQNLVGANYKWTHSKIKKLKPYTTYRHMSWIC